MKEALDKIQAELVANPKNKYAQVVGAFLIDYVRKNPQEADKIMTEGKSITGSLSAMRDEASKHKEGNVGVLTPDEGFNVVLNYFGVAVAVAAPTVVPTSTNFNVSFDDL